MSNFVGKSYSVQVQSSSSTLKRIGAAVPADLDIYLALTTTECTDSQPVPWLMPDAPSQKEKGMSKAAMVPA